MLKHLNLDEMVALLSPWVEDPKPYLPKGPSGVAVRTLAELALNVEEWGKL